MDCLLLLEKYSPQVKKLKLKNTSVNFKLLVTLQEESTDTLLFQGWAIPHIVKMDISICLFASFWGSSIIELQHSHNVLVLAFSIN